jgi:hypothetical protein
MNRRMFPCIFGAGVANLNYPKAIIKSNISYTYSDPNNIIIDTVISKCTNENYGQKFFFCANTGHRNKVGYISNVRMYHGFYNSGDVSDLTYGNAAVSKCTQMLKELRELR